MPLQKSTWTEYKVHTVVRVRLSTYVHAVPSNLIQLSSSVYRVQNELHAAEVGVGGGGGGGGGGLRLHGLLWTQTERYL